MKKIIISMSLWGGAVGIVFSQVGINTDHPKGIFHIDAKKDNVIKSKDSIEHTTDDVVFNSVRNGSILFKSYQAYLGVGKIKPEAGLDINGTMRLENGAEGNNKILVSKDNLGNATWVAPLGPIISVGKINDNKLLPTDESPGDLTEEPLKLTQGKWLVLSKFVVRNTIYPRGGLKPRNNVWIYLKNMTKHSGSKDPVFSTVLGVPVEQDGYFIGTPQLAAIVNVPKGEEHVFRIFGSTSNIQFGYATTSEFQGSYFYAVRLDVDLLN